MNYNQRKENNARPYGCIDWCHYSRVGIGERRRGGGKSRLSVGFFRLGGGGTLFDPNTVFFLRSHSSLPFWDFFPSFCCSAIRSFSICAQLGFHRNFLDQETILDPLKPVILPNPCRSPGNRYAEVVWSSHIVSRRHSTNTPLRINVRCSMVIADMVETCVECRENI